MRSMHYYIKLAVVCASLGLTAIFGQAQEIVSETYHHYIGDMT